MSTRPPPPSPEAQIDFLAKLQRLFSEGDFTATYKYALLISLADLAVELGADDGSDLVVSNREIAEKFIALYWQQAMPYTSGRAATEPAVLIQNLGRQASILTAICEFRKSSGLTSYQQAKTSHFYVALVTKVATTVSTQPLTYLQNFGGVTDSFIYERGERGTIQMKPGVAYCLRRFYSLVQKLSRMHWVDHIKSNRQNHKALGEAGDLDAFLFTTSRQSLKIIATGLHKLDGSRCFYCEGRLNDADVDHFVPFSLYPRDLAHNFVLSHPTCNRSKSDTLAAKVHLERWLERLTKRADELQEIGAAAGVNSDRNTSMQVASWGYASSQAAGGHAWVRPSTYELVDETYGSLFAGY